MGQEIKIIHFKDGLNHEFEIIDLAKIYEEKKDMLVVAHRAQFYHILWIEQGEGIHYVDFNPVEFKDNTIIFIPHNNGSVK